MTVAHAKYNGETKYFSPDPNVDRLVGMVIGLAAQLSALAETVELTNRALIAKNLLKEAELERLAELDEVKAALKKSRQSIVDAMQLSMRS